MKTNYFLVGCTFLTLGLGRPALRAQDTTAPTLVSASTVDGIRIGLCFSEVMDSANLEDPFSYRVSDASGPVGVVSVSAQPGNSSVILLLSPAVTDNFSIVVDFVRDLAGHPIGPGSTLTSRV